MRSMRSCLSTLIPMTKVDTIHSKCHKITQVDASTLQAPLQMPLYCLISPYLKNERFILCTTLQDHDELVASNDDSAKSMTYEGQTEGCWIAVVAVAL